MREEHQHGGGPRSRSRLASGGALEVMLAQYHECYKYLREHDRFIWQMLSIGVAISSATFIASYHYLADQPIIRGIVLLISSLFMFSLGFTCIKNRHFCEIEQGTLTAIEDILAEKYHTKRIQRTSKVEEKEKDRYWYSKNIGFIWSSSAHRLIIRILFLIHAILLFLSLYEFLIFLIRSSLLNTLLQRLSHFYMEIVFFIITVIYWIFFSYKIPKDPHGFI